MFKVTISGLDKVLSDLDKLQKGIERNKTLEFKLSPDEEGNIERQCPECERIFKINIADWNRVIEPNEFAYCPFCHQKATVENWNSIQQLDQIRKKSIDHLGKVIETMGAYSITPSFKIESTSILVTKDQCKKCSFRYSYIGTSFYCPACGDKKLNFIEQYKKIQKAILILPTTISSLSDDDKQNIMQTYLENGIKEIVEIFQVNINQLYSKKYKLKKNQRNIFQRLKEGSELWESSIWKLSYQELLSVQQFTELSFVFQKRHLLVHKQGEIDDDYIKNSGDINAKKGIRINITADEVKAGADIAMLLLTQISEKVISS